MNPYYQKHTHIYALGKKSSTPSLSLTTATLIEQ